MPIFKETVFRSSLQNVVRQALSVKYLQGLMFNGSLQNVVRLAFSVKYLQGLLHSCNFHEQTCSEGHACRNKLYPYFQHLLSELGKIWYKVYIHNVGQVV